MWMKQKMMDKFKEKRKKIKNFYPNRTVLNKYKEFSRTKNQWYQREHKNKLFADKLFYMPIHHKTVPHLFQRHSESLQIKRYLNQYNAHHNDLVGKLRKDFEHYR